MSLCYGAETQSSSKKGLAARALHPLNSVRQVPAGRLALHSATGTYRLVTGTAGHMKH